MRHLRTMLLTLSLVLLAACVTINVYFPAAAAEKAAEQFIGNVIGDTAKDAEIKPPPPPPQAGLLDFFIGSAHAAEPDLNIQTPAVRDIQARMKQRFDSVLTKALAAGSIGLTRDGLVAVRDAAAVPLAERSGLNQAVAEENRDRKAVYAEIARANAHH